MIRIGQPRVKESKDFAFLENDIEIDGVHSLLWFKVDIKYKDYLCFERGDAYLIASLNYAMRNHHDMEFDVPISARLLFNIQTYLIPALLENNSTFYSPKIIAKVEETNLPNAGKVGTGISCGVDSLHALATKSNTLAPSMNITHLTFNNVGSHGVGENARKLFAQRIVKPESFAKEYGYEFVMSDSNLMDVIEQNHFKTHTYSSMFPIFCLQKLYSIYYYASSGYRFNEFRLKDLPTSSCGSYELLSLDIFSTNTLKIYSEGMGKTRLDKLKDVINYKPSYKYLNVCLDEGDNCNVCEKCVRTLLELDILGSLDKYSNVFDVNYYRNNKNWYLKQLLYQKAFGKHDYFEIYQNIKKEIPYSVIIQSLPKVAKIRLYNFIRKKPILYSIMKRLR